ncbi:DNA starvation/stationary phase protection protein [Paraliobacillus quinghaiensis]|uniref:DNA starvation/stationary phase protection protein n=1 Tax=Paraliobacillus quinghaiensis TaxID=470815 RepID=A0A917WQU2_9BACI|nr:DNA starvation/stationary phase protection protein [Paraliobacillus quinghaiensis]GGM22045.1 DNA starvation/stationary phase protection protein [Paraliobacillus quinghaiensis]
MQENKKLVQLLNHELSNIAVLYIKLHRYHWYVKGSEFFTLHEVFEAHYTELAKDFDELAERILAIGGKPFATMEKYLETTSIKEAEADDEEAEIVRHLSKDYRQVIKEIREKVIPEAGNANDLPTEDLLIGMLTKLEKYVWMLEAYQKSK